jgi:hypothetical protein
MSTRRNSARRGGCKKSAKISDRMRRWRSGAKKGTKIRKRINNKEKSRQKISKE